MNNTATTRAGKLTTIQAPPAIVHRFRTLADRHGLYRPVMLGVLLRGWSMLTPDQRNAAMRR